MSNRRVPPNALCLLMLTIVLCICAPSLATITFSSNTLTYSSPSDLGTTIDPSGLNTVATSYGITKASFQALNPQVVAFNGAPAPTQTLRTLVVNYDVSNTVTFTFPSAMYNYGSYTSYGRGAFSGSSLQDAISTVPTTPDSLNDWFDATITSTGGRGVQSLGFCAAFRNDQAVPAGQALFTLSDATTAYVTLPALGGSGNPQFVFIGYTAPSGKTITRVQASRASAVGGAWVSVDDLSFVMSATSDTTPPAAVTNLASSGATASSVTLTWTAPGDDGNTGTATTYDIRYSTSTITAGNWSSATQVSGEPAPLVAGTNQSMTVSGLAGDTTYYFAMKTADEVPNWSTLSNVISKKTSDTVAPAAVSNLATSSPTASSIVLSWTAPGDNGSTGTATTYDIRYSTSTITAGNWASATQVSGEPTPLVAGTNQSMTITGLAGDTTYYFAIETADEVPNWSTISNVPSGKTSDTVAPAAVNNLATSSPTSSSITLTWTAPGDNGNTGTATTYDIRYSTSTITAGNWASATQVSGEPAPLVAGSNQSMTVSGLAASTTYYFAIETADEVPNWSALSNVPSGTTAAGGTTWNVSTTSQLENAGHSYASGDTIIIAAGTYSPTSRLACNRGAVTFKGATGNRDDVIIQGPGMLVNTEPTEMFDITSSNVTVQDLTVRNVYYHGVHVRGESNADSPTIRNVKIIDCGERFIKGSTDTTNGSNIVDNLLIENCYLEQVTALSGRSDNDYIGGIDMMGLNAPTIRNCTIKNIRGATGGGRGGIFLWQGINNPTIERNTIIGCDRGICIGNPMAPGHVYMPNYHSTSGIIRNNMVTRGAGIGMELCYTKDLKVYYNSIYSADAGYSQTLHLYDTGGYTTNLRTSYNIIRGNINNQSTGGWTSTGDITGSTPATNWFVDPTNGNLHLTSSATPAFNIGVLLPEVPTDFDNQTRSSTPDIGADEY